MPNTTAAKKALRNSRKKEVNNKTRKYAVKQALKELRRVLSTSPKNYHTALSKVFSSLDKAVKRNVIPKGRANRKKSRVSAMVDEAIGTKKPENAAELRAAKKNTKKAAAKKKTTTATKATTKKATAAKKEVKKTVSKTTKSATKKATTAKAPAKKTADKKATTTAKKATTKKSTSAKSTAKKDTAK